MTASGDREGQAHDVRDHRWAGGLTASAAAAGHDLGNLLTAMFGHAELAREQLAPDHPARGELDDLIELADDAHDLARRLSLLGRAGLPAVTIEDVAATIEDLVSDRTRRSMACVPELDVRLERPVAVVAPPTLRDALDLLLDQQPADAPPGAVRLTLDADDQHVRIAMTGPDNLPLDPEQDVWRGGAAGLAVTAVHAGALMAGGRMTAGPRADGGHHVEIRLRRRQG